MSKKIEDKQNMVPKNSKFLISNIIIFAINLILCIINLVLIPIFTSLELYACIVLGISALLLILSFVFFFLKKIGWLKTSFIILLIATVFIWGYFMMDKLDLLKYFKSQEDLQNLISQAGIWGYVIFTLLQFLQVTFIPIPAIITTMVGTFLFGPGTATILSLIGVLAGSVVAFVIGDKCGEKVVAWIVGKETTEKYSKLLFDKGKYLFFLMMLFPVFPDDALCLIAGMTTMSYKFFLTTILLTRPIGIIMTCYLGSGDIIPYTETWGLIVWAILVLIMLFAFWFAYRYKDKIEKIVTNFSDKVKIFFSRATTFISNGFEDFISLFSKSYKTKILLKRNKYKLLLLPEKAESLNQSKTKLINKNLTKTAKSKNKIVK